MERKEIMKYTYNDYLKNAGFTDEILTKLNELKLDDEASLYHEFYYHKDTLFERFENYDALLRYQLYLKLYCNLFYKRYLHSDEFEAVICLDGCKDLYEWAKLCYQHFNVWGIHPNMWMFLDRLIEGKITRFGRLEFEPKAVDQDIHHPEIYIPKKTVLLNVHVPSGVRLTRSEIDEAYVKAVNYFKGITPIFHCSSWLLSPQLKQCLNETSGIMQFKKDYLIYNIEDNSDQFIERVWPDRDNDPNDYINFEEDTVLQRKAKQILLSGKQLQKASGICISYYHQK